MAYKGQPVPTTTYQQARAKVSDGKSVRVSVPANSGPIEAGTLVEIGGFLGFATQSLPNDSNNAQDLILNIEQAEYETDQIDGEGGFEAGTLIFWDSDAKELTEDPEGNRPAGRITVAKDDNDVIWFILGPQVFADAGDDNGSGGGAGE